MPPVGEFSSAAGGWKTKSISEFLVPLPRPPWIRRFAEPYSERRWRLQNKKQIPAFGRQVSPPFLHKSRDRDRDDN